MVFCIRENGAKQELNIFENNQSIEKLKFTNTIFPLISAAPFHTEIKISAPSNNRAPLSESLIVNLPITKFKCIRNMYGNKKKKNLHQNNTLMKITSSYRIRQTMIHNVIIVVIYCWSERGTDKILKVDVNNSLFFEISASLF